MPVKDNWANGQTVTAADLNELGGAVNALEESALTQADIDTAVTNLKGSAGAALDTLGELSDALEGDANYAATVTTALGTKARKSGNVYHVSDNGLVGNWSGGDANAGSGTNDTTALNTLITAAPAGSTILFDGSKTYRLDPLTVTKTLTFDFNGASVVTKTMTAGALSAASPMMSFTSTFGTETALVSSGYSRGGLTVTTSTAANAGNFTAGDHVMIYGDASPTLRWDTDALVSNHGPGEVNVVESVNSGTGVVTLSAPLRHNYPSTALKLRKIAAPASPIVKNVGRVIDTDPGGDYSGDIGISGHGPHLFDFYGCIDPRVENVQATSWQGHVTHFMLCLRPLSIDVKGVDPLRTSSGHGYVGRMNQCVDGKFIRSVGVRCRHTCDYVATSNCGSALCDSTDLAQAAYITHGLNARDSYSLFDTAKGSGPGWYLGNSEYNSDYGFTIVNPTYYGSERAVRSWSNSTGLRLITPNIHTSSDVAVYITASADDSVIDARNGIIEATGASAKAIVAADTSGTGNFIPSSVTVYGNSSSFVGTVQLTLTGTATLRDVPSGILTVTAGTVDYGRDSTAAVLTSPRINDIYDTNGNIIVNLPPTASAVNRLAVGNATTTNAPVVQVTGSDTNISLDLRPKNTGKVRIQDPNTLTKRAALDPSGVTGTRTFAFPDASGTFYVSGGTDVSLADGGTGASLTDPGTDQLMFWDDSANTVTWLTLGTNLSITGTTINAAGGGGTPDDGSVTTAKFAAATLVTASETIGSNNNDTTIPTSAAVKAYADSVGGGGGAVTPANVANDVRAEITGAGWFPAEYVSGQYYFCNSTAISSTFATGFGSLRLSPWVVTDSVTITRLFADVATAGDAASVFRMGVYADTGTGYPGTLVIDAGTISGGSAAVAEVTISQALTPGLYWVGGALQGTGTVPTMRTSNQQAMEYPLRLGTSLPAAATGLSGFVQSSVTGALPGTFTSTVTTNNSCPRIGFKVA